MPDNLADDDMAAQSDPERLRRLNWRERWQEWRQQSPLKASGDGSASGSAGSPTLFPVETSLKQSAATSPATPASSSAGSPAEGSDEFHPLTVVRTGQSAWVRRAPGENIHWTNEDFARLFLQWLAAEYPASRDGWVNVPDLEADFFDRFRAATGCELVEDGALLRGLGRVTEKREKTYTNAAGKRYSLTEYKVPKAKAAVVPIAAAKAKRA